MAAAAPSALASSVEKTNGAKLSRLLIDGGTTVLRNVFDRYHSPANLAADLNANYITLANLFKKKVLHKHGIYCSHLIESQQTQKHLTLVVCSFF